MRTGGGVKNGRLFADVLYGQPPRWLASYFKINCSIVPIADGPVIDLFTLAWNRKDCWQRLNGTVIANYRLSEPIIFDHLVGLVGNRRPGIEWCHPIRLQSSCSCSPAVNTATFNIITGYEQTTNRQCRPADKLDSGLKSTAIRTTDGLESDTENVCIADKRSYATCV